MFNAAVRSPSIKIRRCKTLKQQQHSSCSTAYIPYERQQWPANWHVWIAQTFSTADYTKIWPFRRRINRIRMQKDISKSTPQLFVTVIAHQTVCEEVAKTVRYGGCQIMGASIYTINHTAQCNKDSVMYPPNAWAASYNLYISLYPSSKNWQDRKPKKWPFSPYFHIRSSKWTSQRNLDAA